MQLLLCYLYITDPQGTLPATLLSSVGLALVVAALSVIVLIELVVVFAYSLQFQLLLQLKVYRYILFPMALILLAAEIEQQRFISTPTAAVLMVILIAMSYFINFIIHCYQDVQTSRTFEKATNYFLLTDCMLVLAKLPASFLYIEAIAVCLLLLHLLIRHRLAHYQLPTGRQKI